MISNKAAGSRFETELCELLAQHGFWAHNLAQNRAGQPADVIAVKNNLAVLIDCKVCTKDCFALSRVECNQEAAMTMWRQRGNLECCFALRIRSGEIYMVDFADIGYLKAKGRKAIPEEIIKTYPTFLQWVEVFQ